MWLPKLKFSEVFLGICHRLHQTKPYQHINNSVLFRIVHWTISTVLQISPITYLCGNRALEVLQSWIDIPKLAQWTQVLLCLQYFRGTVLLPLPQVLKCIPRFVGECCQVHTEGSFTLNLQHYLGNSNIYAHL